MSLPTSSPLNDEYDAIIIGAGMSGLAAGIRLSMFGRKVCILEKHTVPGGLNSYYKRGKRKFDVGLHALTNFCERSDRKKPLNKLLRQLRLSYDDLKLNEQIQSKIFFPQLNLIFTNDFSRFQEEIKQKFPLEIEAFNRLVKFIESYNELDLSHSYQSARSVLSQYLSDSYLLEMLLCPLLIYGSAWERDMDWTQFVVMFKSIYLQGFSRPTGGVRTIVNLLLARLEEEGCKLFYGAEVLGIDLAAGGIKELRLKSGELLRSQLIISSIGHPETMNLCHGKGKLEKSPARVGNLSFTESLMVFDRKELSGILEEKNTIIFYNNGPEYEYRCPSGLVDNQSAVICFPQHYVDKDLNELEEDLLPENECLVRMTFLANAEKWWALSREDYRKEKENVINHSMSVLQKCLPNFQGKMIFKDVFTPKTIFRYTGHLQGSVYGSPDKIRDGKTTMPGLYLCGTDQGFLGIVGAMLSGITVANLYGFGSIDTSMNLKEEIKEVSHENTL